MVSHRIEDPRVRVPPPVTLRHLVPADRDAVRRWMRDPEVANYTVLVPGPDCVPQFPPNDDAADIYFRALLLDHRRRAFAIMVDGLHVGNVGLRDLHLDRWHGECFIEIGEACARRRGVGTEAMRQVLAYAFGDLELDVVNLGVFEFNHAALELYRRLGFRAAPHYGWHWRDDKYWQVLGMSLRREEWKP